MIIVKFPAFSTMTEDVLSVGQGMEVELHISLILNIRVHGD